MKNYGTTYSAERPEEVDVKSTKVFVASDIKEEKDGGYSYDLTEYDKDEYEAAQSGKKTMLRSGNDPQYFTTFNGYYCKDAAGRALLAELEDIVHPDLVTLNAVQNGVYVPTTSYGYGTVNVNVPFYARTDATLADVSTVEGDEMHIEPTAGTSYYPRLFLMATPSPNPESVAPVDVGKLFEPESGSWAVQPYIDIIDKATGQSVTGYPQQVNTGASFAINAGGYCRVKSWSYANDKISVTTTRWNTTYSNPINDTYATQNDVDDWCSAYATPPYVIYSDIDTQYAVGDIIYPAGQPIILPPTADRAHSIVGIRIYGTADGVGVDASTDPYIQHGGTVSGYIAPVSSVIGSSGGYFYAELGNSQLSANEHIDVFNLVNNYTGASTTVATACDALANVKIKVEGRRDEYNRFIHAPFSFIYEVT